MPAGREKKANTTIDRWRPAACLQLAGAQRELQSPAVKRAPRRGRGDLAVAGIPVAGAWRLERRPAGGWSVPVGSVHVPEREWRPGGPSLYEPLPPARFHAWTNGRSAACTPVPVSGRKHPRLGVPYSFPVPDAGMCAAVLLLLAQGERNIDDVGERALLLEKMV